MRLGVLLRTLLFLLLTASALLPLLYLVLLRASLPPSSAGGHLLALNTPAPFRPGVPETVLSLRYRLGTQARYRRQLAWYISNSDNASIARFEQFYHRDVRLQTGKELLGPSLPIYSGRCLQYLSPEREQEEEDDGEAPKPPPLRGRGSVSVVISYHNELPILLFRTLTNLLHHTPPHLLHEIVLIDDGSHPHQELCTEEKYEGAGRVPDPEEPPLSAVGCLNREVERFAEVHGVRIRHFRSEVQLGITNGRRMGVELATGDYTAILDSHMIVTPLWLQPLLSILATWPTAVAVPCINMIYEDTEPTTLTERYTVVPARGFGTLSFRAYAPPDRDKTLPYPSPGLAGGALLAESSFLKRAFPRSLLGHTWGVENSRLALRAWLCGAGVHMSCCSQVIHPNGNDPSLQRYTRAEPFLLQNLLKEGLAEALNYVADGRSRSRLAQMVAHNESELVAMSAVIAARWDTTGCRDYRWFTENVFREESILNANGLAVNAELGRFSNGGLCIESSWNLPEFGMEGDHNQVFMYRCHDARLTISDPQYLRWRRADGTIRTHTDRCWSAAAELDEVRIEQCVEREAGQVWRLKREGEEYRILHVDRCLSRVRAERGAAFPVLRLRACEEGLWTQLWGISRPVWAEEEEDL